MSAAQSQTTLRAKLEALQCHFTWELDHSRSKLLLLRDNLEDIGTEEGYLWLGHIYNLQGYIHYQLASQDDTLGSTRDDALRCLRMATEAFRQIRNTVSDEGPWLLVNYGNLAWLYHHLGEQVESQSYVAKIEALLLTYPSPPQDELHADIYAEKAWTLMKFSPDRKLEAIEYFQRAISVEPDRVEWRTSHVLALESAVENHTPEREAEMMKKLEDAKEHDPENSYLAALYLGRLAKDGKKIEDEARKLAKRVLEKPVSSYSGIRPLLRLYRMYLTIDEAVDLADEALERHPNERYLKSCLATCYKWKIFSDKDSHLRQSVVDRAIGLHKEVISLYPHTSLPTKFALASLYAESTHHDKAQADQIYKELLESRLEPAELQMLYYKYANYLNYHHQDRHNSIIYHMKVAEIPQPSTHRNNSIKILRQIKDRRMNRMCGEIEDFLANLQE
uniref:interferon-induced protein with tetratricopeptide repeats 1-like n=1 Tax=Centroberyx gerrardi TaxID=166262 RepID=UPI003AAEEA69